MSNSPPSGIGTKFLLVSAAIIIILAGLKAAQSLISPFLLAVFFALILTPPLRWLKKKGLSDGIAILALSTFVFLLGLGIILIFSNSLTRFAEKLPAYKDKITAGYVTIDAWINNIADKMSAFGETITPSKPIEEQAADSRRQTAAEEEGVAAETTAEEGDISPEIVPEALPERKGQIFVHSTVEEWLAERQSALMPGANRETMPNNSRIREKLSLSNVVPINTFISSIQVGINVLLNIVSVSSLVLIMLVFMLLEAARMPDKVREAFGGRDLSHEYFKKIADDTWNYMKIKTIICFLTGLSTTLGLWFLGVEYAILWGLLMFFLNYIPNIGQVIASVPPILLALIDGGVSFAIGVTLWLILVNSVFGLSIEPRYMGSGLGISSLIVLLSLIFWGWLLGPVGMFLSAPLTMVMKIVLQNDAKTRWIAVLLSNR